MTRHRLAHPSAIAEHLKKSFFSTELGWRSYFGDDLEAAYEALLQLSPLAPWHEVMAILSNPYYLSPWLCASCHSPSPKLFNLGRETSSFFVCERCLDNASAHLKDISL